MAIDKIELAAEIEKNPEIVAVAQDALTKKGFVIRDKAANDTFLDNYKKDIIEKEIPAKISEVHNKYDTDIESIYGVKKDASEKTHEYLKRAANGKLTELNAKIAGFEKIISEKGDPNGVFQKKIEAAEELARKAIAEKDATIKDLSAKTEQTQKSSLLTSAYSELSKTFTKTLPPLWDRTAKIVLDDILKNTILEDGVLYIGDGNGLKKKDASFNPIKVEDVLKTEFKDVIDTKRSNAGAGSGKGGGKDENAIDPLTINKDTFVVPASVRTQDDLMTALLESGVPRGSKAFNDIWDKYAKGVERVIEGGKTVIKQVGKALPAK